MAEFRMPSLGADMESGTLVEWLINPGDPVKRGDVIATVETQKGLFEVEVFEEGVMGRPLVQPGQEVPVGTVLVLILNKDTSVTPAEAAHLSAAPQAGTRGEQTPPPHPCHAPPPSSPPPIAPVERIAVSPSARKLAVELGVDLGAVPGSGPHGVIQRSDIEAAARTKEQKSTPDVPNQPTVTLRDGMRQAIAAAMSRSNREIPHYYLEMEIDLDRPLSWLEGENLKRPLRERILPAALLLKGVSRALLDVPELNGYWLDNRLQVSNEIHIGFAVSLRDGGLITPAIHHVNRLSLQELMKAMGDLIQRTRAGHLRSSEMGNATITMTNLGELGVKTVFGVIYPPQVALVGFGRIMERPWAENGMLGVRRAVTATLAADHRATDGHRGSQFLESLNQYLQHPEKL